MSEPETCCEWLGSLSEYIDGDLSVQLCAELEAHMRGCERCRVVVDTLRKTVSLYQQLCAEDALPEDVHERLLVSLKLEDFKHDHPVTK